MTRDLGDNIKVKCGTIAGTLNMMRKEGQLVRRRRGRQKVLWSLAEDGNRKRINGEEEPPKTASRFVTASQKSKKSGKRLVDGNSMTYPVEN